jgi:carbamoyltransferase
MSKILGIFGGTHNANIAFINDGKIEFCLEEEKTKGIKSIFDFGAKPIMSLEKLYTKYNIGISDFDYVCWCEPHPRIYIESIKNEIKHSDFYSHHHCHAAGAYYTSNYKYDDKVLIITLDGGGQFHYGKVYLGYQNKIEEVHSLPIQTSGSLGQLWMQVTEAMGWKMLKDEGKIMGMAGHGKIDKMVLKLFSSCVDYKNLKFLNPATTTRTIFVCDYLKKLDYFTDEKKRKNIAATLQALTENCVIQYIKDLLKKYSEYNKLALAGGIFANVKMNKHINEIPWVDEIYVYPPMGDDGLALGAAIIKAVELGEYKIHAFDNVFLGTEYSDDEIANIIFHTNSELEEFVNNNVKISAYHPQHIATYLNEGKIIGIFDGKIEYGPRALGSRSILTRATDLWMHEELNKRLKRHEIMPFAPIVLGDYENIPFECTKSLYTAEFMTICYDTRKEWIDRIPAVVHDIDHTARPQIVTKMNGSKFFNILQEYNLISGIPVLLNTSFNGHGEPILENPEKALKYLMDNTIDILVINDKTYIKNGSNI